MHDSHGQILRNEQVAVKDHYEAAYQVFARMHWTPADLDLMALRVVQGGDQYREPVRIDDHVTPKSRRWMISRPYTTPSSVAVFRAFSTALRGSLPAVVIFDSSFRRTIPPAAHTYALPHELAAKHKIRRYGFHGISHNS